MTEPLSEPKAEEFPETYYGYYDVPMFSPKESGRELFCVKDLNSIPEKCRGQTVVTYTLTSRSTFQVNRTLSPQP